ncbi:SAM-dependent methyltransferase [Conexibacter stalactiti]|uniref:S-adenosyl-L-methionine-dependent methyltransferase n=1 Tax=Conexibacter stalactiti TaxID=1940611 RepID=A0ABU4HYV5_9ACTN|nr:SAM-dependent methyltransferase [Conexibacter stalactiti]MDW5598521.1 SAM-dependent methyltransferase [Conexibacter stalactiti]MEC5039163.1 SAM-dependent methyltransferase [Conexibacter stalactiti]
MLSQRSSGEDAGSPAPPAVAACDAPAPLPAVAATAVAIARERAAESVGDDRLFADPLAARFAAAADRPGEPAPPPLGEMVPVMRGYVALRTRAFDDALLVSGCRQVVLLAAGLDARAFRLPWPAGTALFELDVPELVAFKEPLVEEAATCARTVLAVDLRDDWRAPLLAAGFDPAAPTAWLAEGLLMYLSPAENDALLRTVGELSAPGSVLLAEHVPTAGTRPPETDEEGHVLDAGGASWRSTLDDPIAWLAGHGWAAAAIDAAALATSLDRPLPPVLDRAAVGDACAWLLQATRSSPRPLPSIP